MSLLERIGRGRNTSQCSVILWSFCDYNPFPDSTIASHLEKARFYPSSLLCLAYLYLRSFVLTIFNASP